MFGLFHTPKLLVSTAEKVAIERELIRLSRFFGQKQWQFGELRQPDEYWPKGEGTDEDIRSLFQQLTLELNVNPDRIRIVFSNEDVDSVSGMTLIHTSEKSLDGSGRLLDDFRSDLIIGTNLRMESVLGEMVRALVTVRLIQSGYACASRPDFGLITEVATAFFGYGLFTVNETVTCCQSTSSGYHYFSIFRLGALNSFGTGYLLALVLWTRRQLDLESKRFLRPDAQLSFQKSIAFLEKTNDSLLADPDIQRIDAGTSLATIEVLLKNGTPTVLVWVLESVLQRKNCPDDVLALRGELFRLLRHHDTHVAKLALHLIGLATELNSQEIKQLQKLARSRDTWVSSLAANILSRHLPFARCEAEFARLVDRYDSASVMHAAQMAERYGHQAARYTDSVCNWIRISLNRCEHDIGVLYTLLLLNIAEDPPSVLQHFFGDDPELLGRSLELMQDAATRSPIEFIDSQQGPSCLQEMFAVPAWLGI